MTAFPVIALAVTTIVSNEQSGLFPWGYMVVMYLAQVAAWSFATYLLYLEYRFRQDEMWVVRVFWLVELCFLAKQAESQVLNLSLVSFMQGDDKQCVGAGGANSRFAT